MTAVLEEQQMSEEEFLNENCDDIMLRYQKRDIETIILNFKKRFGVDILTESNEEICKKSGLYNYKINDFKKVINNYYKLETEVAQKKLLKATESKLDKHNIIPITASIPNVIRDQSVNEEKKTTNGNDEITSEVQNESSFEIPRHLIGRARRVLKVDWTKPTTEIHDKDYYDAMNLFNELFGNIGSVSATNSKPAFFGNSKFIQLLMNGSFQKELDKIRDYLETLDNVSENE